MTTKKNGEYVEGNRLNRYINGNLISSHVAGTGAGDVGKYYDVATGKIVSGPKEDKTVTVGKPYYTIDGQRVDAAQATAAQRLEAIKASMLRTGYSPEAVNRQLGGYAAEEGIKYTPATPLSSIMPSGGSKTTRVYGPETRQQYDARQALIAAAPSATNAAYIAKYGESPEVVSRWQGIRDALQGKGKWGPLAGLEGMKPQQNPDITRGMLMATGAAIEGYTQRRNALVEEFNRGTYRTQAEYDAALAKLNQELAPIDTRIANLQTSQGKQVSKIATEYREYEKTAPIAEGAIAKIGLASKTRQELLEAQAYEQYVKREASIEGAGLRIGSAMAFGGAFGVATGGPVGLAAGTAVGAYYGLMDVGARLSTIALFPGKEHLRLTKSLTPGKYTIPPEPTLSQYKAGLGQDRYTRVMAVEDIAFKTNTASILAYTGSIMTAGPVVGGAAQALRKPLVNAQAFLTSAKVFPNNEFIRGSRFATQTYGQLGQKVGPVQKAERLDMSIFKGEGGVTNVDYSGQAGTVRIFGRDVGYNIPAGKMQLHKDTRIVSMFEGPQSPFKYGYGYESVTAISKDVAYGPGKIYGKAFKLDFTGGMASQLYPLKAPTYSYGKVWGAGGGVSAGGRAIGFNVGVVLPSKNLGQAPGIFGQVYSVEKAVIPDFKGIYGAGAKTVSGGGGGVLQITGLKTAMELPSSILAIPTASATGIATGGGTTGIMNVGALMGGLSAMALSPPPGKSGGRVSGGTELLSIPRITQVEAVSLKVITATRSRTTEETSVSSLTMPGIISIPVTATITTPISVTTPITATITTPITAPITAIDLRPITIEPFTQPSITKPSPFSFEVPPIIPFDYRPELPSGGNYLSGIVLSGTKRKKGYRPDVRASYFNIKGEMPKGILSGLELRPIPKSKRRKGFLE